MAPRTEKGTWKPGVSGNPTGKKKLRLDGWGSTITGIGDVLQDKRQSHAFYPTPLSYEQCVDIHEGDDLGKRAASGPVEDAFRYGYDISITDKGNFDTLKDDVKKKIRKLGLDKVIKKAISQKRALGGSAILLGVRDNKTMDRPLDRDKASNIEFLTNLEPRDLTPHSYYEDPLEPKFGEVKLWELRSHMHVGRRFADKVATTRKQRKNPLIHETRLIVFNNERISKYSTNEHPEGEYWGLSIYTQIYEILRDFNIAWAAAGLIVVDFSQPVFSVPNLMQLVQSNEEDLINRMRAMNMGRSVARCILKDTEEEFERKSVNVTGLPDMLTQLSRRFSASIDIPLSVLMSSGDKSESAEIGDELRYYYDRLESLREEEITPVVQLVVEIIMRGLRQRGLPKRWSIKWRPLWKLTDEQQANARLAQARVDAIYVKHGVLDPNTVAKVRFSGEYSFDTVIPSGYEAPGFMVLPPMGVLVGGKDPKTGLPPGEQPPQAPGAGGKSGAGETGAHGVSSHARRNPRQTSMAGSDTTAGGDTAGKADADDVYPEDINDDLYPEDED